MDGTKIHCSNYYRLAGYPRYARVPARFSSLTSVFFTNAGIKINNNGDYFVNFFLSFYAMFLLYTS